MPAILRLTLLIVLLLSGCGTVPLTHSPASLSGGINDERQRDMPYLVMISIDGFRWDYLDIHPTPFMNELATQGVRAERLLPVYPTLTFPNHYSIVTGLYPAQHGIVANEFPIGDQDYWYKLRLRETVEKGENYRGEPLWISAEKQGMVAAAFFWVGSEADIGGSYATHWRTYNKEISGEERVDQVLEWLSEPEETRPHLYNMYFEDVDDYTHWYGPESAEGAESASRVDAYVKRLLEGIRKLPHGDEVNILLVSDHGQAQYFEEQDPQILSELLDTNGLSIVDGGSYMNIYLNNDAPQKAAEIRDSINSSWSHATAYLPEDAPPAWQVSDDPRFPDVLVVAEVSYGVWSSPEEAERIHPGDHGWAPEDQEMHGFLLAWGPAFKEGLSIGPVKNIDVQSLALKVLSLEPPQQIDGNPDALTHILK